MRELLLINVKRGNGLKQGSKINYAGRAAIVKNILNGTMVVIEFLGAV